MSTTSRPSTLRRRIALTIATAVCVCAFMPSLADAADFCVHSDVCGQGGNYLTLEGALKAADSIPTADRVFVGPGTYTAPDTTGFRALVYPVEIIGAGRDKTVLTGPTNTAAVLTTRDPASAVSDLQIVIPDANDGLLKSGLVMTAGSAKGVSIVAAAGTRPVVGADIAGTLLEDSQITLPETNQMTAIMAGTDSKIHGVDLTAGYGVDMFGYDVHVDRVRVTTNVIGMWAIHTAAVISNSLIHVDSAGLGINASTGHDVADVGLIARNLTVVGDGGASTGINVNSFVAKTATVIVDSTIIRGVKYPLVRHAAAPGTALLGVAYSDYDPFSVQDSGDGALAAGQGNASSDPLFKGPADFHLLGGSPAIDAGNPNATTDVTDLDGNPRVVGARRDMGAYETQPEPAPAAGPGSAPSDPPPPGVAVQDALAPTIGGLMITPPRFKAKRGARIRFTLTERANVRIAIERLTARARRYAKFGTLQRSEPAGMDRIAIKRRVAGATLRAGRYAAVVTATDAAGNRSRAYKLKFRVLPA
jgi:hypothetical protein